jgi:hypothetical protein
MVPLPLSTPTQASYCNYRYDIAALMPQLLDAMTGCNTLFTKYEQVLRYDEKMRKLATACMPTFLSNNAPVATGWPIYVGWARRSLAICASHKIIMVRDSLYELYVTCTLISHAHLLDTSKVHWALILELRILIYPPYLHSSIQNHIERSIIWQRPGADAVD